MSVKALVVLDALSRRVLGPAVADHMRAELVVAALRMALWRYTSARRWKFAR